MGFDKTVIAVSVTLICAGFVGGTFPKTKLSKSLGLVISLVVTAIVVGCISNVEIPDYSLSLSSYGTDSQASGYVAQQTLKVYERKIKQTLLKEGIDYTKIEINTEQQAETINVKEIVITTESKCDSWQKTRLEQELSAKLVFKTKVGE